MGGPTYRPWRLAFCASLLAGVLQIALIRELSASYALSSVELSIRLMLAAVIAAYGIGAACVRVIERFGERRAYLALGAAVAVYTAALLVATLRWLEPRFAASAADSLQLLALGALVAPPFAACGMVVAHCGQLIQRRAPREFGAYVAVSLLGTFGGIALSHHYGQWVGVNALLLVAAACSLPLLLDRVLAAAAVAVVVTALPAEQWLEAQRETRPDFFGPVTLEETERVFSGWSPYQKLDLYRFKDEVLLGCYNGFWQWWVAPRTDHPNAFPGYALLYRAEWIAGRDVLVIGSGAGMGLLELEARAPRSITAIELDPLVVELARGRFAAYNDRIYERVDVLAMDGRSYLEATESGFDVIIYEGSFLTAAHPRAAVSAENYLYTVEGVAAALKRLRAGGLGIVSYAGGTQAFARVREAIEANGAAVASLRIAAGESLWPEMPALLFGKDPERVERAADRILAAATRAQVERYEVDEPDALAIADKRPFLYAGERGELRPLEWALAACVAVLAPGLARAKHRRVRIYYFLIGTAFMLVQYAVVSAFRSFLGDPVTTAYTVVLVLLVGMAVGSAQLHRFLGAPLRRQLGWAALALAASVAAIGSLPLNLGFAPFPVRFAITALAALPIGFVLGIFFPLGMLGQSDKVIPAAYLYDALGTVAGFLLFYLVALRLGISAPLAIGALLYALALWALLGWGGRARGPV